MITGNLQRKWSAERPQVYDKESRIVCLDIKEEAQADGDGGSTPAIRTCKWKSTRTSTMGTSSRSSLKQALRPRTSSDC